MAKTSTEIFNDKVSLIYEYNKKSPLFLRMANTEIENNNVERAIEILNNGINQYPDFAAAHLLLGKALTLVGNYSEALKSVRTGSDLIHSQSTYEHYLKEIEIIRRQRAMFRTTNRSAFMNEDDLPGINKPLLPDNDEEKQSLAKSEITETKSSVDERLGQLAQEISSAKIPEISKEAPAQNFDEDFSGESMIVSETLAKIYIAQGEYKEAVEVYEKLKRKSPHQVEYYNQKIAELKKELE
ncbi:MAG: tetratricopeptide repeat protein [Ignavibacteriaceae bacterium]